MTKQLTIVSICTGIAIAFGQPWWRAPLFLVAGLGIIGAVRDALFTRVGDNR